MLHKNTQIEMTCLHCKKYFWMHRFRKQGERIFCSLKCFNDYRKSDPSHSKRIRVNCAQCSAELWIYPYKFKKNKFFYCDIKCRKQHIKGQNNPAYTGGVGRHPYYGPHWKSQRRAILGRDNYTCQYCKKHPTAPRSLEVHHITPFYVFGGDIETANDPSNLITLCVQCHKKAERGQIIIQRKLL